jgi:DNA helicase-2/ATP-dependent DNA helicase PcrA
VRRPLQPREPLWEIVDEEGALLERVVQRLTERLGQRSHEEPVGDYDADLVTLRDQVAEAKPEDVAALVAQMIRVGAMSERRRRVQEAPVDLATPYFAHLRLRVADAPARDILVGKRSFVDRAAGVTIVDWRDAPISRVYYRYEQGDDFDEELPGGHREGVVEVRRNVSISPAPPGTAQRVRLGVGVLRRVGAPEGTALLDATGQWWALEGEAVPVLSGGQGAAARPPASARGGRSSGERGRRGGGSGLGGARSQFAARTDTLLPEIAALIDPAQFDLITQPSSGLVVIQGGAGSGKTTVALHRVAYLNFADSHTFRAERLLVLVSSEALVRYVARVLPSLGVHAVRVTTVRSWLGHQRRRLLPGKRYTDETPAAVARLKKHPALLSLLERWVRAKCEALTASLQPVLAAATPADAEAVRAAWERTAELPLAKRPAQLGRWLKGPAGGALLAAPTRHRLEGWLRGAGGRAGDVRGEWGELFTDLGVLERHFSAHAPGEFRAAELADVVAWCTALQSDPRDGAVDVDEPERSSPVDGGSLVGATLSEDGAVAGRWDVEDDAVLLRLHQLICGGLDVTYEHVALDEAQDLSAMELRVLLDVATARQSITISGDVAQRVVFDNGFRGWRELLADAGVRDAVEIQPLAIGYRSTAQVMEVAHHILGPLAPAVAPRAVRSGAPVELHTFVDVGEQVAFLGDALRSLVDREPDASVALLARYPETADLYFDALRRAEVPRLRRVKGQELSFSPGIDITEAGQVKGLEFDYVVILDATAASYPDSAQAGEVARHLLHIAVTRAAHQLWLCSVGPPSPLLPPNL